MPTMKGFEVAQETAPLIAGKPTIILAMLTSSSSPLDQERAASMPVSRGYLTKPLTIERAREPIQRSV